MAIRKSDVARRRTTSKAGSKMARAGAVTARRAGPAPHPGATRSGISSKSVKAIDIAHAAVALDTAGSTVLLDIVPQGTGFNERVGLKWKDTAVHIRGCLRMSDSAVSDQQMCTMYLVWDKQPNGAKASVGSILDDQTLPVALAYYNLENADRFKILFKKNFKLIKETAANTNLLDGASAVVDEYVKLPSGCVATGTNSGIGTIGDRKTGALLALFTGTGASTDATNAFTWTTRVYFDDV